LSTGLANVLKTDLHILLFFGMTGLELVSQLHDDVGEHHGRLKKTHTLSLGNNATESAEEKVFHS
jgi:hypothetical protein